jgi:hypothetical protein
LNNEIIQSKEEKKEDDELSNQKHILEIKEMLKDNEKAISEKNIRLEEKEYYIKD